MDDGATPPLPPELAVLVAGDSAGDTLGGYAEQLRGKNSWSFWWD